MPDKEEILGNINTEINSLKEQLKSMEDAVTGMNQRDQVEKELKQLSYRLDQINDEAEKMHDTGSEAWEVARATLDASLNEIKSGFKIATRQIGK